MASFTVRELTYQSDSSLLFERVRDLPCPVFLDSAWPYSERGRYDIISAAPLKTLSLLPLQPTHPDLFKTKFSENWLWEPACIVSVRPRAQPVASKARLLLLRYTSCNVPRGKTAGIFETAGERQSTQRVAIYPNSKI